MPDLVVDYRSELGLSVDEDVAGGKSSRARREGKKLDQRLFRWPKSIELTG
jgi:hypothetical protein